MGETPWLLCRSWRSFQPLLTTLGGHSWWGSWTDEVSFQMMRYLHPLASAFLFSLCNRIWVEDIWLTAYAFSILKPGKNSNIRKRSQTNFFCIYYKCCSSCVHVRKTSDFLFFTWGSENVDPHWTFLRLDYDIRKFFSEDKVVLSSLFRSRASIWLYMEERESTEFSFTGTNGSVFSHFLQTQMSNA